MLVFVDESGDTGVKIGKGSSEQFTITLVVFPDNKEAEAASKCIDQLRNDLHLSASTEFHFNENSNEQREAFLQAVSKFKFLVFSVVVNKPGLAPAGVTSKGVFYNLACGLVFENAKDYLSEASVTLDSTGDQTFKRQLSAYLKQKINEPGENLKRIKKVGMKPSHGDNLLQLTDMVCGAIARSCHESAKKSDRFRKIIQHREISVLFWPR